MDAEQFPYVRPLRDRPFIKMAQLMEGDFPLDLWTLILLKLSLPDLFAMRLVSKFFQDNTTPELWGEACSPWTSYWAVSLQEPGSLSQNWKEAAQAILNISYCLKNGICLSKNLNDKAMSIILFSRTQPKLITGNNHQIRAWKCSWEKDREPIRWEFNEPRTMTFNALGPGAQPFLFEDGGSGSFIFCYARTVSEWDAQFTRNKKKILSNLTIDLIRSAEITPKSHLVLGSQGNIITDIDLSTEQLVGTWSLPPGPGPKSLVYNQFHQKLVSFSSPNNLASIHLLSPDGKVVQVETGVKEHVHAITSQGNYVYSSTNQNVLVFDIRKQGIVTRIKTGTTSGEQGKLICCNADIICYAASSEIIVFETHNFALKYSLPTSALCMDLDQSRLAVGTTNATRIFCFDSKPEQEETTVFKHKGRMEIVKQYKTDAKRVASPRN